MKDEIVKINKAFLAQDDSNKWPVNGAFNVTAKAIFVLMTKQSEGLKIYSADQYKKLLDKEINDIYRSIMFRR